MQVQQMIRNSADVITITTLSPGNVYKRVEESSYGEPTLRYGVVQDVMNNGEDSAVTALEYLPDYAAGASAALKVWTGSKPVALFPATPDEVLRHLDELEQAAESALTRALADVQKRQQAVEAVARLRLSTGSLTAPETASGVLDAVEYAEDTTGGQG